jgi:hypothetical protein
VIGKQSAVADVTAGDPALGYREELRRDGLRDGSKLFRVLVDAHDATRAAHAAALAAQVAVREGVQGLAPDKQQQLVDRLVEQSSRRFVDRTEGMIERRTSRLGWRALAGVSAVLLAGMVLAGAVGWWLGSRDGAARMAGLSKELADLSVEDPAVADVWARLIRYNPDPRRSLSSDDCRRTAVEAGRFRGCLAPLWYDWVGPPPGQARRAVP